MGAKGLIIFYRRKTYTWKQYIHSLQFGFYSSCHEQDLSKRAVVLFHGILRCLGCTPVWLPAGGVLLQWAPAWLTAEMLILRSDSRFSWPAGHLI